MPFWKSAIRNGPIGSAETLPSSSTVIGRRTAFQHTALPRIACRYISGLGGLAKIAVLAVGNINIVESKIGDAW